MNSEVGKVENQELKTFLDDTFDTMDKVLDGQNPELRQYEVGTVEFVGRDIARVSGLPHIQRGGTGPVCRELYGTCFQYRSKGNRRCSSGPQ